MAGPLKGKSSEQNPTEQDFARVMQTLNSTIASLNVASESLAHRFDRISIAADKFEDKFSKIVAGLDKLANADAGFLLRRSVNTTSFDKSSYHDEVKDRARHNVSEWSFFNAVKSVATEPASARGGMGGPAGRGPVGGLVPYIAGYARSGGAVSWAASQSWMNGVSSDRLRTHDSNGNPLKSFETGERSSANTSQRFNDITGGLAAVQLINAFSQQMRNAGAGGVGMLGRPLALASPNAAATLGGSFDSAMQAVGEKMLGPAADLSKGLQDAARFIKGMDDGLFRTSLKLSAWSLAIGVGLPILTNFFAAAKMATQGIAAIGGMAGGGFLTGAGALFAGVAVGEAARGRIAKAWTANASVNSRLAAGISGEDMETSEAVGYLRSGALSKMNRDEQMKMLTESKGYADSMTQWGEDQINKRLGWRGLWGAGMWDEDHKRLGRTKEHFGKESIILERMMKQLADTGNINESNLLGGKDGNYLRSVRPQSMPGVSGLDVTYDRITVGALKTSPLEDQALREAEKNNANWERLFQMKDPKGLRGG